MLSLAVVRNYFTLGLVSPGLVTILGQVNHRGTGPGTQVSSSWAIPPWVGEISTSKSWRSKQAHRVIH